MDDSVGSDVADGAASSTGRRVIDRWWLLVCAGFAYLPALASSPGRLPADTKLALYLDPARLTTEAPSTFDAAQYAGWVPHQQIAYLWPSGPWYWLFDSIGVPDWIAHRLWVGTLLFAAGTGVRWFLRRLEFSVTAALAGGLAYQLSPYVLPYVSRTSSLLLPFAALGWIAAMTLLATRDRARLPWRWPAAIALIVATVGAVNATALLMIVPAPALVLLFALVVERAPWRRIATVAGLTTISCSIVSLWWISMLLAQREHGPDVLAYSESLRSVSASSTSLEVFRGLGYWLFYVRDHVGATTTASLDHLTNVPLIVVGFAASLLPLVGLVADRAPRRRLGAWCVAIGAVIAVGVHPIDAPSPIVRALGGDLEGGLALALRSSTRAVPVLVLGVAIGAAGLVQAAPWPRFLDRRIGDARTTGAAVVVVVLVFAATPSWWTAALVDPNLDRDAEPPAAWQQAVATLDASPGDGRLLQLPGAEFGAFEWGVTVDQPLPYLTDRSVVTRDLLPLGSPAAMDLIWALDDRAQDGILESGSIGPVARWLGVDHVWVVGDLDVERYNTARPGVVAAQVDGAQLGATQAFGTPVVAGDSVVDEELLGMSLAATPIEAVRLTALDQPGSLIRVRAAESQVVVAGSGAGLVDAAAAGVLSGNELVVAAATITPSDGSGEASAESVNRLVITDSFRDRARHWRSSQDTLGFTEAAGPRPELLTTDDADERLPVFDEASFRDIDDADRTVARFEGEVVARATAYGEPFAYLPEHRPAMAIDGDAATAWIVAEHGDPVGERIELSIDPSAETDGLVLHQPAGAGHRTITSVSISSSVGVAEVALDERSWSEAGQAVPLGETVTGVIAITITAVSNEAPNGVGFSEIDLGLDPTTEWVATPRRLPAVSRAAEIDVVMTRLRAEATDRWRDDPEATLRRIVTLPDSADGVTASATVTVRLDPRATDVDLVELLGGDAVADRHLLGAPSARGAAALDGDDATSWITPFGDPIGPTLSLRTMSGSTQRIVVEQPDGPYSRITSLRAEDATGSADVALVDGVVELPRPFDAATLALTIIDAEPRRILDRRFGDIVLAPAAISELDLGDDVRRTSTTVPSIAVVCQTGWITVDGADVPISFEATPEQLLVGDPVLASACDDVELTDEVRINAHAPSAFQVDRVVLSTERAPSDSRRSSPGPVWQADDSIDPRSVTIEACPDGCWVVLGHGFNPAWRASLAGTSLGPPTLVDGNANGWWIDPFETPLEVRFDWTAQTPVTLGIVASVLGVIAIIAALTASWSIARRRPGGSPSPEVPAREHNHAVALRTPIAVAAYVVASLLLIGATAAIAAAALGGLTWFATARKYRIGLVVALGGILGLAAMAAVVALIVWREQPPASLGWPARFERWHEPGLLCLLTVPFGLEIAARRQPELLVPDTVEVEA